VSVLQCTKHFTTFPEGSKCSLLPMPAGAHGSWTVDHTTPSLDCLHLSGFCTVGLYQIVMLGERGVWFYAAVGIGNRTHDPTITIREYVTNPSAFESCLFLCLALWFISQVRAAAQPVISKFILSTLLEAPVTTRHARSVHG